jgi:hypothetical protein
MNDFNLPLPDRRSGLADLFEQTRDLSPIQAAEIIRLSGRYNVPADQIASSIDAFKNGTIDNVDWAALERNSPKTAEFLQDPYYMATIRNRTRQLEDIEGAWKPWRALKEGGKDVATALIGALKGKYESDVNTDRTVVSDFDPSQTFTYKAPQKPLRAETLDKLLASEYLQPKEVKGDTAIGQFGLDVVRMAPQIASQWAAFALTGGAGSMAFMGSQIAGSQYLKLTRDGVASDRAFQSAMMDAIMQAPLEQIGLGKVFKKIPAGTSAAFKAREVMERTLTEGITEWMQQYPEAATELWAKHPDKTPAQLAGMFADDFADITQEGIYQGLVAAPYGFLGGAISVKMQEQVARQFVAQREVVQAKLRQSDLSGLSPEVLEKHSEYVSGGASVYVDPDAVVALYQSEQIPPQEIEEKLGITIEQARQAEENGELLKVSAGRYDVAAARDPRIHDALKESIAQDENGLTLRRLSERAELNKSDIETSIASASQRREELKAISAVKEREMRDAGMSAEEAKSATALLIRHAHVMSADPAAWLRDKAPLFVKGKSEHAMLAQLNEDVDVNASVPVVKLGELTGVVDRQSLISHVSSLVGKPISAADQKAIFNVLPTRTSQKHIVWSSRKNKRFNDVRKASLLNIKDLIENAVLIESQSNQKSDKKPGVSAYHRFYVPVEFGGEAHAIRIVAEETNGVITLDPTNVDLYDVLVEKNIRNSFPTSQAAGKTSDDLVPAEGASTITIRQMLSGVKDMDGKPYIPDKYEPGNLLQSELGFYSGVDRALANMDFHSMPANDLLQRIQAAKGIKQEEIEWLGLVDFLKAKAGKVTKEEVLAFVRQGGVTINEVTKGAGGESRLDYEQDPEDGSWRVYTVDNEEIIQAFDEQAEAREFVEKENLKRGNTKFGQYQLPGGDNYREVLLTLPEKESASSWTEAQTSSPKFQSSHWSEPNVLAHFRLNDRSVDGRRVLFVEEIQSDWHQKGKKEGYGKEEKYGVYQNQNLIGEYTSKNEAQAALDAVGGNGEILDWSKNRTIDAPFKSTPAWSMLAFKRILRMAVEQGYDSVAWTPGEVQAERYDLSKTIDSVEYTQDKTGTNFPGVVRAYPKGGDRTQIVVKRVNSESELSDTVGKELAEKIMQSKIPTRGKNAGSVEFRGLDLKVGGEGMKGFYDKILPAEVGKYVKKMDKDAKVVTVSIGIDKYPDVQSVEFELAARRGESLDQISQAVWSVPITDKIRDSVLQGQSLFQNSGIVRGGFSWHTQRPVITLFERANTSTIIHEMAGHYFMYNLFNEGAVENAPEWMQKDRRTMLEYVGISENDWPDLWAKANEGSREEWNMPDADLANSVERREIRQAILTVRTAHEKMAKAAEAYFMTGEAPTIDTRSIFRKFKDWLTNIYFDVSRLGVEMPAEVRKVFDRMVATQEEIEQTEAVAKYHERLPAGVYESLTDGQKNELDRAMRNARERAEDLLRRRLMADLSDDVKKEIEGMFETVRSEVVAERAENVAQNLYDALELPLTEDERFMLDVSEMFDAAPQQLLAELTQSRNRQVEEMARYLRGNHGDGVETVLVQDPGGYADGGYRVSHNAKWYQDFYAEHKRQPTLEEFRYLAEKFLSQGFEDAYEVVPPSAVFLATNEAIQATSSTIEKTKASTWDLQKGTELSDAARMAVSYFISDGGDVAPEGMPVAAKLQSMEELIRKMGPEFEAMATASGFDSADAALVMLKKLKPMTEEIGDRVRREVDEKYNLLRNRDVMRQAAEESMYTDEGLLLVAAEQQILEEKLQGVMDRASARERQQVIRDIAKRQAGEMMSKRTIEEALRLQSYIAAERRAAEKASWYMAKGDLAAAKEQKMLQVLNHALVQQSLEMRREFERINKYLYGQRKAGSNTWESDEHFYQAAELLRRFGFIRRDYGPNMRKETLAMWMDAQKEKEAPVAVADWLTNETIMRDPRKLTMDQYKDVENALRNIKHIAKQEKRFVRAFEGGLIQDAIGQMAMAPGVKHPTPEFSRHKTTIEKMAESASGLKYGLITPETMLRLLDGREGLGAWWQGFYRPFYEAANSEATFQEWIAPKLKELFAMYTTGERKQWINEKMYIPELQVSFTRGELLMIAMNWGNDGNKNRLISGWSRHPMFPQFGETWREENLLAVLEKYTDARDWEFVQGVWDLFESLREDVFAMHKRATGFAPQAVEAEPVRIHGKTYRGGYFPLVKDTRYVVDPRKAVDEAQELSPEQPFFKAMTKKGHTEARMKGAVYPVSLDMGIVQRAMDDSVHDLTHREAVIDANKLMADPGMQQILVESFGGKIGYEFFDNWIKAMAGQVDRPLASTKGLRWFSQWLRRNTVINIMGARLSVLLQTPTSLTSMHYAAKELGISDTAGALASFYSKAVADPGYVMRTLEEIYAKSPEMKNRVNNVDASVREVYLKALEGESGKDKVARVAMATHGWLDRFISVPFWLQAYQLQVNAGKNDVDAVAYADMVIRRAFGSGLTKDRAAWLRSNNELTRWLTMFSTYMNAQLNMAYEYGSGEVNGMVDASKAAGMVLAFGLFPAILEEFLAGRGPDQDDDDEKKAKWWTRKLLSKPIELVPGGRAVSDMVFSNIMGLEYYGFRPSPISLSIDAVAKMLKSVYKVATGRAKTQETLESAGKVVGLAVPIPDQFLIWLWNTVDYWNSGMKPHGMDLIRRRAKDER